MHICTYACEYVICMYVWILCSPWFFDFTVGAKKVVSSSKMKCLWTCAEYTSFISAYPVTSNYTVHLESEGKTSRSQQGWVTWAWVTKMSVLCWFVRIWIMWRRIQQKYSSQGLRKTAVGPQACRLKYVCIWVYLLTFCGMIDLLGPSFRLGALQGNSR